MVGLRHRVLLTSMPTPNQASTLLFQISFAPVLVSSIFAYLPTGLFSGNRGHIDGH